MICRGSWQSFLFIFYGTCVCFRFFACLPQGSWRSRFRRWCWPSGTTWTSSATPASVRMLFSCSLILWRLGFLNIPWGGTAWPPPRLTSSYCCNAVSEEKNLPCSVSVTFWYGSRSRSGSADPYLWPDPDLFVSDLQDAKKKNFYLLLFEATFTSFFKDKKT